MNKYLKWTLISLLVIVLGLWLAFRWMSANTKKASPEKTTSYVADNYDMKISYCSPAKKGREIFGGLVPFGEIWRTGANEATTFTTASDLTIDNKTLAAGTYTLWTKPEATTWTIYFNSGEYPWGVSWGGKASRDSTLDVLAVSVPVVALNEVEENFAIYLYPNPLRMRLAWNLTAVDLPIQ